MSDAITLIDQEIETFEEKLQLHSYHLFALRELRDKINRGTGLVSTRPVQEKQESLDLQQVDSEKPKSRRKRGPSISEDRVIQIANLVADRIRREGGLRHSHLRKMAKTGQISSYEAMRMPSRIQPSRLGVERYNEIFRGTKYANKK
jgi:hypothetical protein